MTTVPAVHRTDPLHQVALIARRSVSRTFRQPELVIPVILFPLILLAVNAAGLASVTELPGFPTDSYINFAIVVCFVQGALFAAITAGTELASDIQKGFLDRLSLTPARQWTVLVGATFGGTAVSIVGSVIYLFDRAALRRDDRVRRPRRDRPRPPLDLHRARVRRHRRVARDPDGIARRRCRGCSRCSSSSSSSRR